mmetsp:Transcript_11443/g.24585  ORF Transcript_11443/g.24585 Transcript_11443/m.24585 type:complete len:751 (+) Transcript_11443:160-2412(+)|eukprot:CAMPEP_0202891846 /NCGR_PEP_ID=MMETSP1392-20130828/1791_1 /ASSEMBLY_ACC=CAM_ASM_000868 /TAXON_ID=225041 /ORGANISM="Chlamydomonas chlamydogama, Strain SAG 11-48b" /LENGTH=750 /DNA_ID=CAMNT_0049575707 /DNA_START=154 /DNA_END=2406 /DNA_ORIENTATION=+
MSEGLHSSTAPSCCVQPSLSHARFQALGKLGSGAYGVVLKAQDSERGELVAVKKLNDVPRNDAELSKLLREAQILQVARHPNIVRILDAYQSSSGRVYLIFEHVDKTISRELLFRPKGLPAAQVKVVMWQLLQAVSFLHSRGILHRDLKPENILISNQGLVKICDFGFARAVSAKDEEDANPYAITRWYRAPEVLVSSVEPGRVDPYGPGVDVWALGCVMAILATGKPLLTGQDRVDQLAMIEAMVGPLSPTQQAAIQTDPRLSGVYSIAEKYKAMTLEKRLCNLPPAMQEVIRACLQPDPESRPSAAEVLQLPFFDDVDIPPTLAEQMAAAEAASSDALAIPPVGGRMDLINSMFWEPPRGTASRRAASTAPAECNPQQAASLEQLRQHTISPSPLYPVLNAMIPAIAVPDSQLECNQPVTPANRCQAQHSLLTGMIHKQDSVDRSQPTSPSTTASAPAAQPTPKTPAPETPLQLEGTAAPIRPLRPQMQFVASPVYRPLLGQLQATSSFGHWGSSGCSAEEDVLVARRAISQTAQSSGLLPAAPLQDDNTSEPPAAAGHLHAGVSTGDITRLAAGPRSENLLQPANVSWGSPTRTMQRSQGGGVCVPPVLPEAVPATPVPSTPGGPTGSSGSPASSQQRTPAPVTPPAPDAGTAPWCTSTSPRQHAQCLPDGVSAFASVQAADAALMAGPVTPQISAVTSKLAAVLGGGRRSISQLMDCVEDVDELPCEVLKETDSARGDFSGVVVVL